MPVTFDGAAFSSGITVSYNPPPPPQFQYAIIGYGITSPAGSSNTQTNLVSNVGVVAANTPLVGTARRELAGATYGTDKAIFGYGWNGSSVYYSMTNKVSNVGVVATDTPGVGTSRPNLAATGFGTTGQAIFGYGSTPGGSYVAVTNIVSNAGVVATDTPGVGTARYNLVATTFGSTGQALFAFGATPAAPFFGASSNLVNQVSSTGVVATDTTTTGTGKSQTAGGSYGSDKAIFGYGVAPSLSPAWINNINLVSNTGVIASDTPGVGSMRSNLVGATYGYDKFIFAYGFNNSGSVPYTYVTASNLVSNTGVVATDTVITSPSKRYGCATSYG